MTETLRSNSPSPMPKVRMLSFADLARSLRRGIADFAAKPQFGLMIGLTCALFGIAIVACIKWLGIPWMIYPFAIGFPLAGPFLAVGLYEVSRRIETGEPVTWSAVGSRMWAQRGRELSWMAFVVLFVMWVWVYQVRLLMALFLGMKSFSTLPGFIKVVTTTTEGFLFLGIGHAVGAALAIILFSLTVVSIPLLMEKELDIVTAMIISVKAVLASPLVMIGWGLFVTLAVIIACLPLFLGLVIVLPVLGHTTWHIYKSAVV
ncbi:MAG: DUF2189 domain-containing protein [Rhizobiaceae bacterium]